MVSDKLTVILTNGTIIQECFGLSRILTEHLDLFSNLGAAKSAEVMKLILNPDDRILERTIEELVDTLI